MPNDESETAMNGEHGPSEQPGVEQWPEKAQRDFSTLVEHATDMIVRFDTDLRHLYCNPAVEDQLGAPVKAWIGKTPLEAGGPRAQAEFVELSLRTALETGEEQEVEQSIPLPSGTKHFLTHIVPERDEQGRIQSLLAITRDITERKQVEELLLESEEKYRSVFNNFIDLYYQTDMQGLITNLSPSSFILSGWKPEEQIGRQVLELYSDPEQRKALLEKLRREGEVSDYEITLLHRDGRQVPVSVSSHLIMDEKGNPKYVEGTMRDITERKRAEQALQNERSLLRTLIDNIPDSIYSKDLACRKTLANLTELHYLGAKSESEVLGKDDFEFYPKEIAEGFFTDDQSVMLSGQPVLNKEELAIYEDGQKRWLLTSKLPLKDESGNITGIVGIGRDITERKRADEALHESEEKFRVLADSTPTAIMLYQHNKWVYANPAAAQISGYSTQELLAMNFWDTVHPDHRQMIRERGLERQQGDDRAMRYEIKIIAKDGRVKWVDLAGASVMLRGNPAGIVSVTDITERKQAEEALQESEERYRSLFENMLDGYAYCKMLYDDQGNPADFLYLDVNSAFERLTGLCDVVGKTVSETIPGTREATPELFQSYSRVALTGQPEEFEIDFKPLEKWLSISVYSPAKGYFVAVFNDITERKELEERIRQVRSDLLFAVSHDLKSPLQALHQTQEMLNMLTPGEGLARFQEYSEIWRRNLQRLERMINNLVDSQRTEEGRFPLLLAPCDLTELVKRVVEDSQGYALSSVVSFDLKLQPVPEGVCDEEALSRVVENLLINAVKFSLKGGKVEVRLGMEGDTLLLEVEDHGLGIPADEQAQLFQPFQRGSSAQEKRIPGTGLGLYVCRRIVEEHGGAISLTSEEGKGTIVTVRLPWLFRDVVQLSTNSR
ncbi:MAG: PAS domain S-box protein [bacterium]